MSVRKSAHKYARLSASLVLLTLTLCQSRAVCQQPVKTVAIDNLVSSLKLGRREGKTAAWYVELIRRHGVDFRLTPPDEQKIRDAGGYLGQNGVSELLAAVRENYRMLILVAEFQNLDKKESPAVTEMVIDQLRAATIKYNDTRVEYLGQAITAQQGDGFARVKAKEFGAHFIIWGWFSRSPSSVYANVHFVFVKGGKYWPSCRKSDEETFNLPVTEIDNYSLQTKITEHMTYLTLFTAGLTRLEAHDLETAIARFSSVLELQATPEQIIAPAQIYRFRGYTYFLQENYDAAVADYTKAIALDPADARFFSGRADAHYMKGNDDAAIADYSRAIAIAPGEGTYFKRAMAYTDKGSNDDAIADYSRAIAIDAGDACAYNNRGIVYRVKGDYKAALADFNKAIEVDPSLYNAFNGRGSLYRIMGSYNLAIADYSKAIELSPNVSSLYYYRGLAHAQRNDDRRAYVDFSKALRLTSDPVLRQKIEEALKQIFDKP